MGAAKRTEEVWITYRGKQRQVKSCGIREPKDRVKGFRVEIRPSKSKTKIWVGTFETRAKAQRAYDAAIYLIGKKPYYHLYPRNYFPSRPSRSDFARLRKTVQEEAKKYAEKNGALRVNPVSLSLNSSICAPQELAIETPQLPSVDRQAIFAAEENLTEIVDTELDLEPTEQEEFHESSHTLPFHAYFPSWPYLEDDLQVRESVEDHVPEAYLRGLNARNTSVVNDLLDYPPPGSFNVFPCIQGSECILDLFEKDSSLKLIPLMRERESPGASTAQFDGTPMRWSTLTAMSEDDCASVSEGILEEAYDHHPTEEVECGYLVWANTSP